MTLIMLPKAKAQMQGDGSSDNPYQIGTKDELKKFRDIVNGANGETQNTSACAILTSNIDLDNEEWTPIGNKTETDSIKYSGTFNGNGKKIENLKITGSNYSSGLFGLLGAGTIKYLIVTGSVSAENYAGGIVGYISGGTGDDDNVLITGCKNYVTVTSNKAAGGICGYIDNQTYYCTITKCANNETIASSIYTGGIVGLVEGWGKTYQCENSGNVTYNSDVWNSNSGFGGIAGRISESMNVEECCNYGTISGRENTGGIVGFVSRNITNDIKNCYNVGAVSGRQYTGGIVGKNRADIIKCHNYATVTNLNAIDFVGGIYGYNYDNGQDSDYNYYLKDKVSYYDGDDIIIKNQEGPVDGEDWEYVEGNPLTEEQFKQKDNFACWNFEDSTYKIWTMGEKYPILLGCGVYIPFNPTGKIDVTTTDNKERPGIGDVIKIDLEVEPLTIEWFYDDDNDGKPDNPTNILGTGLTYTIKSADKGHTIIGVAKQETKEDGTEYPEGEEPTAVTNPVKVRGYLPGEYVPLDDTTTTTPKTPDHTPLVSGDEITIETNASDVMINWYYADEEGNPTGNPISTGYTYIVKAPDLNNPDHDDRNHNIIAVIKQLYDENGDDYSEDQMPTQYSTVITNIIKKHIHDFTYTANGATITAVCNGESGDEYETCSITEGLALTLVAPSDKKYDGTASVATIQEGYNSEIVFVNPIIKYYTGTIEVRECKEVGTYTAKVTFGTATAQVTFNITSSVTPDPSKDSKKRVDEETGVTIETKDGKDIPTDITLNVKLNTKVAEKNYKNIAKLLNKQRIGRVYDIKLIQTIDGVEKEIQPSDIEPGTTIIIRIAIPKGINANKAQIVHVHNDIAKFIEDVKVENGEFVFEVSELSDFALIIPKSGIITGNHGFCIGWVVFIIAIVLLVYLALYIFIYFGICEGLIKKLRLDELKNVSKLLGIINMAICGVVFVFALVSLILHTCPITIASFVLVTLAIAAFVTLFIMYLLKNNNKVEEAIEQ